MIMMLLDGRRRHDHHQGIDPLLDFVARKP